MIKGSAYSQQWRLWSSLTSLFFLVAIVCLTAGCGSTQPAPATGQQAAPTTQTTAVQPAASTQNAAPAKASAPRVIDLLAEHLKTQSGIADLQCSVTDKSSMMFRGILEHVGAERYLEVKAGGESFHIYEFDTTTTNERTKEGLLKAVEKGRFSESRAFANHGFVFGHDFTLENRPLLEKLIPAFLSFKPNGAAPTTLAKPEPNKRGLYYQPTRVDALVEHLKKGNFGDVALKNISAKTVFGEWMHDISIGSRTFSPFEFYPDGLTASDAVKLAQAKEKGSYPTGFEGHDLKAVVFANFLFIYDPRDEHSALWEKVTEFCKTFSVP